MEATLGDIESMSYLGRYYADKIRGAAEVAVFRVDGGSKKHHELAVGYLNDAVGEWKEYARIAGGAYRAQLFSRTHYMDWGKILEDVKKEVETVRAMRK